jgi:hypothetical protein
MKFFTAMLACAGMLACSAGLASGTTTQTKEGEQKPGEETLRAPIVSCSCVPKKRPQPVRPQAFPKAPCDYSCDCERQKSACSLALTQEQAKREADLGTFYLDHEQYETALTICQGALKLAGDWQPARDCEGNALKRLEARRRVTLSARLGVVDAHLWRGEANEAFSEIEHIRTDLVAPKSPLGDFDEGMNAEIAKRLNRAKWLKLLSRGLPVLLWTVLKTIAVALALLFGLYLLRLTVNMILRHQRYRTIRLASDTVDWTVWSISDSMAHGGAGPVMDALNPNNNPLLREQLRPSSLLLVPSPALSESEIEADEECPVWRDFLDEPRQAIDMEALPSLNELRRHRFNQMEAFDELDVKLGNIEARGIVGLFRAIRKWLDRGLPAAQGTVYTLAQGAEGQSYACVRITCNWTSEVQALSKHPEDPPNAVGSQEGTLDQDVDPADETISVYASTANDPSIDGIALSAQRAGFKLFHRLIKKSSPSYATAVANFHQGVKLIDEYI